MNGFTGKILHVDLTNQTINIEEPSEEFYRHYAGGSLMGLYYLWKNTPKGADALSPEKHPHICAKRPNRITNQWAKSLYSYL